MNQPLRTLSEGDIFADRYLLQGSLGEGGMGVVFKALDQAVGETIALKMLLHITGDADIERFRREVRLSRRITHSNVARVFDIGEHDGVLYLTMEYIEGSTLDVHIGAGLSPYRAAEVARDIALALDAAHALGTVHRDLKPSNILISRSGRVVLTDFGIAFDRQAPPITQQGLAVGTLAYMAPEQLMGEPVDAGADIYALGLLLHEMSTGKLPFSDRTSFMGMAMARCTDDPGDSRRLAPVPDTIAEVIIECLRRDRTTRANSAKEIASRLSAWLGANGNSPNTAPPTTETNDSVGHMRTSLAFAPLADAGPTLAVLPFRYRGPKDEQYLGDGIAESLIDVLSSTSGMRVVAFAALESLGTARNPTDVAARLNANAIVDGTIRRLGDTIRVDARLVEAPSGLQIWSERFERSIDNVFDLEEMLSMRIAESLRVRIELDRHRRSADPELVNAYLRGRQAMRSQSFTGETGAVSLFSHCLERDPVFPPALASRAISCLRAAWDDVSNTDQDWLVESEAAVALAVRHASNLSDTHLASAILANQDGDLGRAAWALARAIQLAPASAEANAYLAEIQCEGGRIDEGMRRLHLTLDLEPTRYVTRLTLARHAELLGDRETCDEQIRIARRDGGPTRSAVITTELRVAAWRGDRETPRRIIKEASALEGIPAQLLAHIGRYLVHQDDDLYLPFEVSSSRSPRMQSLLHQLATEAHCVRGRLDPALLHLKHAAEGSLYDVQWLRYCPTLAPLRELPEFVEVLQRIERRTEKIWRGSPITTQF